MDSSIYMLLYHLSFSQLFELEHIQYINTLATGDSDHGGLITKTTISSLCIETYTTLKSHAMPPTVILLRHAQAEQCVRVPCMLYLPDHEADDDLAT
jgi:hypothetical protein